MGAVKIRLKFLLSQVVAFAIVFTISFLSWRFLALFFLEKRSVPLAFAWNALFAGIPYLWINWTTKLRSIMTFILAALFLPIAFFFDLRRPLESVSAFFVDYWYSVSISVFSLFWVPCALGLMSILALRKLWESRRTS